MGLKDEQIKELEEDIIEFADIGEYINQPVRTYSSGMRARLGFSICVNINPEILVVDEALSVGDTEFKEKCLEKIQELMDKEDVTVLFVTHSAKMAKEFCERGIVLQEGQVIFDGEIGEAIKNYKKTIKRARRARRRENRLSRFMEDEEEL